MIRDGTEWLQPSTSKGTMPRKTAWLVKKGCQCVYSYGPFQVPAVEYPPWMLTMLAETMPLCGLPNEEDWPNCCNMNLYEDGAAAVGWHSDDESLFQGKFRDILIISLSFGVTRTFELRVNYPEEGEQAVYQIRPGSGDLMTMEGMTQKHCQHRVVKEERIDGPRINLTWRWVVKHNPKCPAGRGRRPFGGNRVTQAAWPEPVAAEEWQETEAQDEVQGEAAAETWDEEPGEGEAAAEKWDDEPAEAAADTWDEEPGEASAEKWNDEPAEAAADTWDDGQAGAASDPWDVGLVEAAADTWDEGQGEAVADTWAEEEAWPEDPPGLEEEVYADV